jgi:hypothetical protein
MPRLAALLLLATALPGQAIAGEEIEIGGSGETVQLACDGKALSISGAGNTITVTGACGYILIDGTEHKVTVERAAGIEVWGEGQRVTVSKVSALAVYGSGQTVSAGLDDQPATLELGGSSSKVMVNLLSPSSFTVEGDGNEVVWAAEHGAPPPAVNLGGAGNRVMPAD